MFLKLDEEINFTILKKENASSKSCFQEKIKKSKISVTYCSTACYEMSNSWQMLFLCYI